MTTRAAAAPAPDTALVPAALAGTIAAIAAAPGAWCPSLSPDGSRVAFISDRSGLPRVEVAPVGIAAAAGDLEVVPEVVSGAGQEAISVAWSPDGSWLAYLVSPAGSIRAELHVVRPNGSGRRLLAGKGHLETVFAGCWTAGGGYAFSMADGSSADAVAFVVDPETGRLTRVEATVGLGFCTVTSVSADGAAMVVRCGPRNRRRLYLIDVAGGPGGSPARPLLPPGDDGPGAAPDGGEDGRFGPDGSVYLRSYVAGDRIVLARVPLVDGRRPGPVELVCSRPDADLEAYALRGAGGSAVLVWNVAGQSRVEVLDLAGGGSVPVHLPQPVLPGWSLGRDGITMIAELTGPDAPRALHLVQLPPADPVPAPPGTTPGPLAGSPDWPLPAGLVRPERLEFHSSDGLPLDGWLYRPPGATGPQPTVISFHGGPESQERPAYAQLSQSLAAAGLTVFAPNVRGSSGFGRAFMSADDGPARSDSFRDVPATAAFLVDAGLADPDALGVYGWSYGGYLAMTALVRWPGLFRAGAAQAGMSDLLSFFAGTERWMAAASVTEYGDPDTDAGLLAALSPLRSFDAVRAPLLLAHGEKDTNVPVGESTSAHAALASRGVPAELLLLPGEGHAIVGADHRIELATRVAGWFVRWLGTARSPGEAAPAGRGRRP